MAFALTPFYRGRFPTPIESDLKPNTAADELPAGGCVLFSPDGLIARPGETLDQGFARLQAAAAYRAELSVGEFCDELLDRMAPPGGYTDDVVLLAVRPNRPRHAVSPPCCLPHR